VQFTLADDALIQDFCEAKGGTPKALDALRGGSESLVLRCESKETIREVTLWENGGSVGAFKRGIDTR
jgi:hypothetical protein